MLDAEKSETEWDRLRDQLDETDKAYDDQMKELLSWKSICDERRQLAGLQREHRKLPRWLLWHIPLAVVSFILAMGHAAASLSF